MKPLDINVLHVLYCRLLLIVYSKLSCSHTHTINLGLVAVITSPLPTDTFLDLSTVTAKDIVIVTDAFWSSKTFLSWAHPFSSGLWVMTVVFSVGTALLYLLVGKFKLRFFYIAQS